MISLEDRLAALRAQPRLLIVSDVDSTFIEQEVIELIAERAGSRAEVTAVTEAAMRGELDFAASLRARVATLAGLPVSVLDEVRAEVRVRDGARELVDWAYAAGHAFGLVSGGFAEVVEPLAAAYGIRHVRANRLEVAGDRLTGRVLGPIVDREEKARALGEFAAGEGLPTSACIAIGDGANDLDMMSASGLSVAFMAKPVAAAEADVALPGPRLDDLLAVLQHPSVRVY